MENRCVCCGEIIPEGRMVCHMCEGKTNERLEINKVMENEKTKGKK